MWKQNPRTKVAVATYGSGSGLVSSLSQELEFNGPVGTENDAVDLYELAG